MRFKAKSTSTWFALFKRALRKQRRLSSQAAVTGTTLSHRVWLATIVARDRLRRQWRDLFREYDVVICPIMPTPAFPHDHSPTEGPRKIEVDGEQADYPAGHIGLAVSARAQKELWPRAVDWLVQGTD
jgi:Asp-tRNA(Asn)/Glu-tRNA(Gln) amidotransferase A subunit family amidase